MRLGWGPNGRAAGRISPNLHGILAPGARSTDLTVNLSHVLAPRESVLGFPPHGRIRHVSFIDGRSEARNTPNLHEIPVRRAFRMTSRLALSHTPAPREFCDSGSDPVDGVEPVHVY